MGKILEVLEANKKRRQLIKSLKEKKEELYNSLGAKPLEYGKEKVQGTAEKRDKLCDTTHAIIELEKRIGDLYKQSNEYIRTLALASTKDRFILSSYYNGLMTDKQIGERIGKSADAIKKARKRAIHRVATKANDINHVQLLNVEEMQEDFEINLKYWKGKIESD